MGIRLITLSENTSGKPGLVAEWGLSIFVKANGENILFDTGAGFAALRNAHKLGISLHHGTRIVLSHAHADHTGGLKSVLARIGPTEVISHPAIWEKKYTKRPYEKEAAFIGIPFAKKEMELLGAEFKPSKAPVQLSENIWTTGEIPVRTDFEDIEPIFYVKKSDLLEPDSIPDDLALVIKSKNGLVIILGCGHRGIINTIYQAQKITGEQRIHTVVGGTHLFPKTEEQREKALNALKSLDIQNIGVSHCTGFEASMKMSQMFGSRFFLNNAGTIFNID